MIRVHITEIISSFTEANFLWILVPIFFIGVITDKYQEEFGTSVGNAISNGALIIFSGFSWLQIIFSRDYLPMDVIISQVILSVFIIGYGFAIIASGFNTGEFARVYGRIRVVTFMLVFFTMIIYVPVMYNFVSILLFVFLFPFYYAFISELVKVLPSAGAGSNDLKDCDKVDLRNMSRKEKFVTIGRMKLKEYFE